MRVPFKVHNELGPFLLEKYYQRGVTKELTSSGLRYQREVPVELWYENQSIGRYFLDFIIEELVVLELKAQKAYHPHFFKQVLAYLRQTNLPLAIIANFRSERLRYRRVVNSTFEGVDLGEIDSKYSS